MADLALEFGGDLAVGPTGDLQLARGPDLTRQRVLRRLLTNTGSYIWQLNYGAGLGTFVGKAGAPAAVAGIVRTQILREAAVAPTPAPTVQAVLADDGTVAATVQYTDASNGQAASLSFSV